MSDKNSSRTVSGEIVADATYDLLAVMLSKLEGLEAYDTYLEDLEGVDAKGAQIIAEIRRDDERHANMLRDHVEQLVQSGGLR
jgi:hypothetical protein